MNVTHKSKRGFTLIELLVVIAIIGVLSSVILASLNSARAKARDAQRVSNIRQMKTAMELYYDSVGHYPWIGSADTGYNITGLSAYLSPAYLPLISTDPQGQTDYYAYNPTGYGLYVYTEKNGGWCLTGANQNLYWFSPNGNPTPACSF